MKQTDCTDEAKTSPSCLCVFVCGGGGGGNGREAGDRIEAGTKLYICSASCFIQASHPSLFILQIPRRNCSFANIVRKYYSRCAFKTLELCSNILQSHNQKAVVNMLDALRVICIVLWSIFRPSDQGLSWVFFPTLHDWLRKFAPLSRPIRSKKKSN